MKAYAGIGSRSTPLDVIELMELVAEALAWQGWTLRSGHAPGADQAFESGAGGSAEIYLPWPTFEHSRGIEARTIIDRPSPDAYEVAAEHHPQWQYLKRGAKALHARNSHQVLGADLRTPVKFILCWTKLAKGEGGTGQAIRIAKANDIPVYDMALTSVRERVVAIIDHYQAGTNPS
jgi:hypothetical protein